MSKSEREMREAFEEAMSYLAVYEHLAQSHQDAIRVYVLHLQAKARRAFEAGRRRKQDGDILGYDLGKEPLYDHEYETAEDWERADAGEVDAGPKD